MAAPWRDLARVYRRLEARGEIRGGHFVSGMSGEQFALPRAIERLREVRRSPADGRLMIVGTADPLNLAGIVTAGERVRASARNRLAYRDGVPVAALEGGTVRTLANVDGLSIGDVTAALRASPSARGAADHYADWDGVGDVTDAAAGGRRPPAAATAPVDRAALPLVAPSSPAHVPVRRVCGREFPRFSAPEGSPASPPGGPHNRNPAP